MACETQNRFVSAIEEYTRALDIWTRMNNDGGIAEALNGIGVCRHRLGQYRSALAMLRDALQKSRAGGRVRVEAYTLASLGDLCHDLGQFTQALTYYDLSHQKAAGIGETYLTSHIASARVESLCMAGDTDRAQREVDQALSAAGLSWPAEARCRLALASALLAQRNTARARQEVESALAFGGGTPGVSFRGQMRLAQIAALEHRSQATFEHLRAAFEIACEAELGQPLSVEALHYLPALELANTENPSPQIDRWIASARELEQTRRHLADEVSSEASGVRHPELQIQSLGSSEVLKDGQPVSWRTKQAKELFFYLLTHPEGQTKEQIGAAIWPEHSQARLFSIFRSSLFRLRKALFSDVVLFDENRYRIDPQVCVHHDALVFEQAISKGDRADNPVQKAHRYRQAIGLYKGRFLADLSNDWIVAMRESLLVRYLQALTFLAELRLERKDYPQAIERARQVLEADELHEAAYYLLVQAYARSGQRPQAKRIYDQCARMLAEYGLSPQKSWDELS
jgi:two-component SAPR family response regulator